MDVRVFVLGSFRVVVDGVDVSRAAWRGRPSARLVKLLALSPGRRLHREQVLEALWPDVAVDVAGPRLHKAAHYARRALGGEGSVELLDEVVHLLPHATVRVDADELRELGREAHQTGSVAAAEAALQLYGGPVLPGDLFEPWTADTRDELAQLHLELLRIVGRWHEVLELSPVDEDAHVAVAHQYAERGDVHGALRQLERLEQSLLHELGTAPGPAALALRARLLGGGAPDGPGTGTDRKPPTQKLVGRRDAANRLRELLAGADSGQGGTMLVSGPPGVGKTAFLGFALALAGRQGWRVGRGTASAVEGTWPYSPVLEALRDLCRQHPSLLDGLSDDFRHEIERALRAADASWTGETSHQRLFVAAAELLRIAAAGHGLLIVVDDVHEADEASTRLLHYLARCALEERIVLLLSHRPGAGSDAVGDMQTSLVGRGVGTVVDLPPLGERATRRLLADRHPGLGEDEAAQIWALSGGLPFTILELARAAEGGGTPSVSTGLPRGVRRTFERAALLGGSFSTDELVAVSGVSDEQAYTHLDQGMTSLLVEPVEGGYRFRHPLVREALVEAMPPQRLATARGDVAEALAALGAAPGRVAHQYLQAGRPARAVPYVVRAVETAGALGAYRDALALVNGVLPHATGPDRGHLLARRGDLLLALGDPEAVPAYREAMRETSGTEHRIVRGRLARAACFVGDFETARAALSGVELEGDAADGPILLARGNLSYFTGDIDSAWDAASEARRTLLTPEDPWHYVDLVALQGLIAHQRGEWFERFRLELRRTSGRRELMTALFDAHLCVAEYLLYGPIPYEQVIELAEDLRRSAERDGALRAVAFATALGGEAALLMGDLDRAENALTEAVDLHQAVDARAGEAHSLQRLAEVRLAQGRPEEARALLQQAMPLARWSVISMHLLQRIYGTMIAAAPDPVHARAAVDLAAATLGETDWCPFCDVMLAVPATIACAAVGDLDEARRSLAAAEASAARWEGSAWQAAVLEARAHVRLAEGDLEGFGREMDSAGQLFAAAGQSGDAARCVAVAARPAAVRAGT